MHDGNMDEENGLGGDINTQQTRASTRHSPVAETVKIRENASNRLDSDQKRATHGISTDTVAYYKLFSFADSWDYLLMLVGTVTAVGNGDLLDGNRREAGHIKKKKRKKRSCLYLKSILRQDIAFFDKEADTGEVVGRMSGDTVLIQDAMGKEVGTVIQLATFLGGFIIAFNKGWLLTLAMLSRFPPLVIIGAFTTLNITKLASRGQAAYSVTAVVVEQTIGSIRTVASFTGEKQAIAKQNQSLSKGYTSGVLEAVLSMLSFGLFMFILFARYSLAMWFGSKMIIDIESTRGSP